MRNPRIILFLFLVSLLAAKSSESDLIQSLNAKLQKLAPEKINFTFTTAWLGSTTPVVSIVPSVEMALVLAEEEEST
ncbi:MAG: hypothetical protein ACJAZC_001642 [Cryomorphaceae bacterium]|jgi:hypothetical protein